MLICRKAEPTWSDFAWFCWFQENQVILQRFGVIGADLQGFQDGKKQNQSVVILGDLGMALPKNGKEAGQARRPADHWKV